MMRLFEMERLNQFYTWKRFRDFVGNELEIFSLYCITNMEPTNDLENKNKNELISMIQELQLENENFQKKNISYTASRREYYKNNREVEIARVQSYQLRTGYKSKWRPSTEQKKEYNKREYLKRKQKLAEEKAESETHGVIEEFSNTETT